MVEDQFLMRVALSSSIRFHGAKETFLHLADILFFAYGRFTYPTQYSPIRMVPRKYVTDRSGRSAIPSTTGGFYRRDA